MVADVIDAADKPIEDAIADGVAAAKRAVEDMPEGEPGVCGWCGEWCGRLVGGACGHCRDKYGLK